MDNKKIKALEKVRAEIEKIDKKENNVYFLIPKALLLVHWNIFINLL